MKPTYVFVELKGPSGNHPGHIIDGHFIIEGDTVHLVDVNGEAEKDVDGTTYSRKLAANEHPKVIARRLVRSRYDARGNKSKSGFGRGPLDYPPITRV